MARSSRLRDLVTPVVAGAAVVAVALGVVLLLNSATNSGVDALIQAKTDQVRATANSFNARVSAQLSSSAGLGAAPWQLTPGSTADRAVLTTYDIDPKAQSGFYLVDAAGVVTNGILLRPGTLGTRWAPTRWAALRVRLASEPVVILPVTKGGLTTELPQYQLVIAITDARTKAVRGALVFEAAVTSTNAFEQEIAKLAGSGTSTAAWFFIDSDGTVVATTRSSGLGAPIEDARYRTVRPGVTDLGSRLVISADVPSIGWRVVFREDRDQFEGAVSNPVQAAGLLVVLLLLGVGLTLVIVLVRRLRSAREEQRRLHQLNRAQAEFVSVVSHELRTPVAGILGFLQTAVDHWTELSESERLHTVRRAVTNARRLQSMTRDVLDADSIEAGRLGYAFHPVDLGDELAAAVEASRAADPAHEIRLAEADRTVTVSADPDRLQQVLANLLENAQKNSPRTAPILVGTETGVDGDGHGVVRVSVTDSGPGIDADSLPRIFDKFVRGNATAVTGTGLGLFIARTIVEAHHGRIWCESTPGSRTTFTVELPVVPAPLAVSTT